MDDKISEVKEMIQSKYYKECEALISSLMLESPHSALPHNLMYAGHPYMMAAFESASVTGNVGLSIGITSPAMPSFLKVLYIVIMWLGRLEFMSVLTLIAYVFRKAKRV